MKSWKDLNVGMKVMAITLPSFIASILLVAGFAIKSSQDSLQEASFAKLTAIREAQVGEGTSPPCSRASLDFLYFKFKTIG